MPDQEPELVRVILVSDWQEADSWRARLGGDRVLADFGLCDQGHVYLATNKLYAGEVPEFLQSPLGLATRIQDAINSGNLP